MEKKNFYTHVRCFFKQFDKAIFRKIEMEMHFSRLSHMTWQRASGNVTFLKKWALYKTHHKLVSIVFIYLFI